jgi:serine/threonine protein kinase
MAFVTQDEFRNSVDEYLRSRKVSADEIPNIPKRAPAKSRAFLEKADRVYAILREHGIEVRNSLGCGSFGCAYAARPAVLKITSDPTEAANARYIMRKRLDGSNIPDGIASIYAVFAFEGIDDVYAITMETLEPLTPDEKEWIRGHGTEEANVAGIDPEASIGSDRYIDKVFAASRSGEIGADLWNDYLHALRRSTRALFGTDGYVDDLVDALVWLYDHGIYYHDVHEDNVLRRTDEERAHLVLFDFGHTLGRKSEVPVLEPPAEKTWVQGRGRKRRG